MYNVTELTDYFEYLDDLRESGATNMFGASAYLMSDYDMPKQEALKVLGAWMNTFDSSKTPADRAGVALAEKVI